MRASVSLKGARNTAVATPAPPCPQPKHSTSVPCAELSASPGGKQPQAERFRGDGPPSSQAVRAAPTPKRPHARGRTQERAAGSATEPGQLSGPPCGPQKHLLDGSFQRGRPMPTGPQASGLCFQLPTPPRNETWPAGPGSLLQGRVVEQLLDQVHVGQQHAAAAVALQAQRIQGIPEARRKLAAACSSWQMEDLAPAGASPAQLPWALLPMSGRETPRSFPRDATRHPQGLWCADNAMAWERGGQVGWLLLGASWGGVPCRLPAFTCTLVISAASSEPGANTKALHRLPIHATHLH